MLTAGAALLSAARTDGRSATEKLHTSGRALLEDVEYTVLSVATKFLDVDDSNDITGEVLMSLCEHVQKHLVYLEEELSKTTLECVHAMTGIPPKVETVVKVRVNDEDKIKAMNDDFAVLLEQDMQNDRNILPLGKFEPLEVEATKVWGWLPPYDTGDGTVQESKPEHQKVAAEPQDYAFKMPAVNSMTADNMDWCPGLPEHKLDRVDEKLKFLFLLGAQKSGTSWLHKALMEHSLFAEADDAYLCAPPARSCSCSLSFILRGPDHILDVTSSGISGVDGQRRSDSSTILPQAKLKILSTASPRIRLKMQGMESRRSSWTLPLTTCQRQSQHLESNKRYQMRSSSSCCGY